VRVPTDSQPAELLSIRGVRKSFGPTLALTGVDLSAKAGEVHAVLGENGAGKSTLMNLLSGAFSPDSGTVELGGAPFAPRGPVNALASGVATVHQELSLCPHLTIAENVLLGREPTRSGLLRRAEMRALTAQAIESAAGPERAKRLAPDTRVASLLPADMQLVEIARALAHTHCRVLILDEPTSSLGRAEVRVLFERIRALRERGLLVLYISHFLEEIEEVADRFTVLRDGRTVGRGVVSETKTGDIIAMMAGRAVDQLFVRSPRAPGDIVLEVQGLAGSRKPEDASFVLRRGEVLGIAGLVGSGRTELLRAIFALDAVVRGRVRVGAYRGRTSDAPSDDPPRSASPRTRLAEGAGMLSEDRKGEGLALSMSVADNVTLSKLTGLGPMGLVRANRQRDAAMEWTQRLGVRCRDVAQPVHELSGGNQQKVALARLLYHDVDVLLLDEPTRGIDVASKADIYRLVDEVASRGKAVLMVSDHLPELLGVSDRIAVMHRGRLSAARPLSEWTEATLLAETLGQSGAKEGGPGAGGAP
jgi:ribose transport system ATP-binding protein